MPNSSRCLRTLALGALGTLLVTSGQVSAAGRDGHNYVIDSQRGAPRTALTRQCIRTGIPDAGALAGDCPDVTTPAQVAEPSAPAAAPTYAPEPTPDPGDGIVGSSVNLSFEAEQAAVEAAMVAPTPAPSVTRITLDAHADFDFGQATLRAAGKAKLDQFAQELSALQYSAVHVVGHTDRIGSREVKRALSLRRAQAVKDYLASKQIDSARMMAVGVGPDQPVTNLQDCQGLKKQALIDCLQPDRRVEIDAEAVGLADR